ncbi:MAG: hypothetical protein WAM71_04350, partial [Candidatus Korobacteraceae bacterium]
MLEKVPKATFNDFQQRLAAMLKRLRIFIDVDWVMKKGESSTALPQDQGSGIEDLPGSYAKLVDRGVSNGATTCSAGLCKLARLAQYLRYGGRHSSWTFDFAEE